ncbi:hypothetical protein [Burkholderia cepacia]|uniref:hypothetical protein n=1 Tax=Burkholderia cepacia TaxID=292 RepID=UPI001CF3E46D|nr:hypothetical protein [Burkholderia cepacia]MCA8331900.1 hypothetical protein [Burkholderia cepacia]
MGAAGVFVPDLLNDLSKALRFFELLPRSNDLEDKRAHLMPLWIAAPDRTQILRRRAIEGGEIEGRHDAE